jgi:hypothetical protein
MQRLLTSALLAKPARRRFNVSWGFGRRSGNRGSDNRGSDNRGSGFGFGFFDLGRVVIVRGL